jgi:hypothetical protein
MKWLLIALGGITVFSGLVLLILPIPLGMPLLIIGVPVLMRYSSRMRRIILNLSSRFPRIYDVLSQIPVAPDGDRTGDEKSGDN